MGRIVYSRKQYRITETFSNNKHGYIIFNTNKAFQDGHTHLNNYRAAKYVVDLAVCEKLPHDLDNYRLKSLYRILEDNIYRTKVNELLSVKNNKEPKFYYNVGAKKTIHNH